MYEEFIHGKAMLNLNNYKLLKANSLFKDEIKDEHLLFLNLDAHGVRRLTRKSLRVNVSKSKPPSVNCGQCCQEKWSPDCEEDVWKWLKLPVTIQKVHRKCLYFMSFETIFKTESEVEESSLQVWLAGTDQAQLLLIAVLFMS